MAIVKALCLPVWNRPHNLAETLASLARVRKLYQWQLFIQLDPSSEQGEVLEVIRQAKLSCGVSLCCNPIRLGVRANPMACLERAAQSGAQWFFYLEDDLRFSADALEFVENVINYSGFSEEFMVGNLHFSGCSNNAHLAIPDAINSNWPGLAIRSKFLSSLGLFFNRAQFEKFVKPNWWRHPLNVRDLHGNRGAGWDYALSEALLESRNFSLQSLLPRVRHHGIRGVHFTPEAHSKGWCGAGLWPGEDLLLEITVLDCNSEQLGPFRAFTTMAQQCWSLQQVWLMRDKRLAQVARSLKPLLRLEPVSSP